MLAAIVIVAALIFVLPIFFPPVTELPFGIEPYLQQFVNQVSLLTNAAPWLETILNVLIIGITVKVILFTATFSYKALKFIRGGG